LVREVDGDGVDGSAKVIRTRTFPHPCQRLLKVWRHFFYDFPIHPASFYAEAPRWQPV
jgi:hypothetical protein